MSEKEKRQVREATRVVARMLCVHPHERPSCKELLRDKFFTDETSPDALRTTPPEKLKGVANDIRSGTANGMFWVHTLSSQQLQVLLDTSHRMPLRIC